MRVWCCGRVRYSGVSVKIGKLVPYNSLWRRELCFPIFMGIPEYSEEMLRGVFLLGNFYGAKGVYKCGTETYWPRHESCQRSLAVGC